MLCVLQAWLAEYQDGISASGDCGRQPFGRAGQLQQAVVLQFGSCGAREGSRKQVTLAAPLGQAAGQLPKLDLYFLLRKYLMTHGGGLQIDSKVQSRAAPASSEKSRIRCWTPQPD